MHSLIIDFIRLFNRSFEYELGNYSQYYIRPPCGNVRAHMISCLHGPLSGCETKLIHQVIKMLAVATMKTWDFEIESRRKSSLNVSFEYFSGV